VKLLLIASIVIAGVIFSFRSPRSSRQPTGSGATQEQPSQAPTDAGHGSLASGERARKNGLAPSAKTAPPESSNPVDAQELPPILLGSRTGAPWEKTIDVIAARTDITDAGKARILIQMLPGLPEEAVSMAAEEAVTRLADADYRAALLTTLINPQTHRTAMSVLFADLMQRPAAIALPILVSVAQDSKHPYSESARENLQFLLKQDFGDDWVKWNEAIGVRLRSPQK
jgi:hypothetical protein